MRIRCLGVSLFVVACAGTNEVDEGASTAAPLTRRSATPTVLFGPDVPLTETTTTSKSTYNFARHVAASQGRVHTVYYEEGSAEGGGAQVYYRRSPDGGTSWAPPMRLSSGNAMAMHPAVAADGERIFAVWHETDAAGRFTVHLRASRDGGATWEGEQVLTGSSGSAHPSVVATGGRVHVVWSETLENGHPEIVTQRSCDDGRSWEEPMRVSDSVDADSYVPTIAAAGDLVLVGWVDYLTGNEEEFVRRSTDGGGSWEAPQQLTFDVADSWAPTIAIAGNDVYFTWFDRRDAGVMDGDVEAPLDEAMTLLGLVAPAAPPRDPSVYYLPLFVERLAQKRAAIASAAPAWVQRGGDPAALQSLLERAARLERQWTEGWELYWKRSDQRGASWGPDIRLTHAPGMSMRPSVVASPTMVSVVWFDSRDGNAEIYHKASNDRGATWSADTRLTFSQAESMHAGLALDRDALHVVFFDERSGNADIFYKGAVLARE